MTLLYFRMTLYYGNLYNRYYGPYKNSRGKFHVFLFNPNLILIQHFILIRIHRPD